MGSNLMRTVTFADPDLVLQINRDFVPVWHDQAVGRASGEDQGPATAAQAEAYPEGGGGTNAVLLVCTADGTIAWRMQGYWTAARLAGELPHALAAVRTAAAGATKDARAARAKSALLARRVELAAAQERLATDNPEAMKEPVKLSKIRREHAALGLLVDSYERARAEAGADIAQALDVLARANVDRGAIE